MIPIELTDQQQEIGNKICVALDTAVVDTAVNLIHELSDLVGYFKIGKELHTAASLQGIPIFHRLHYAANNIFQKQTIPRLFLDLKWHDTPQTVYQTAKLAVNPYIAFFDVHIAGGEMMCRKVVEAVRHEAARKHMVPPLVIGVTELTSLTNEDLREQGCAFSYEGLLRKRAKLAIDWGLDGIVAPAAKVTQLAKEFDNQLLYVTPGITYNNQQGMYQQHLCTPAEAVIHSSILVIGSAITKAVNKRERTLDIINSML